MKQRVIATGILIGLISSAAHAEILLRGFDKTRNTTQVSSLVSYAGAAGFTGTLVWSDNGTPGSDWMLTLPSGGSHDGTFGSLASGATTGSNGADGGFRTTTDNKVYLEVTVKNGSGQAYRLTHFCFDAWRNYNAAADGYALSIVDGDLAPADRFATGSFTVKNKNPLSSDFDDIDIPLASLPETVLKSGESVTFRLTITDSTPQPVGGSLYIDNIGVTGVSEPTMLGLAESCSRYIF